MIPGKLTITLLAAVLPVCAQWTDYRDARIPRTKDGKPNLTAPAPRMNGKPDLSGVWQAERTPRAEFERGLGADFPRDQVDFNDITKYVMNVFWGLKSEEEPMTPAGRAAMRQNGSQQAPPARCLPGGIPVSTFVYSTKMVQAPQEIVILAEAGDPPRQIHLDGRSLPVDPLPTWTGYSVGRWQGDTLVVETVGLTEQSWLDGFGHPRSEAMKIRETYHRRDFGHMDVEFTFEDPKYYSRPFSVRTQLNLIPDAEFQEFVCAENEKDRVHIVRQ